MAQESSRSARRSIGEQRLRRYWDAVQYLQTVDDISVESVENVDQWPPVKAIRGTRDPVGDRIIEHEQRQERLRETPFFEAATEEGSDHDPTAD